METKGNYFLVGVFTLVLSLGMIFFVSWMMSASKVTKNFKKLMIYFPGNISGLTEGSLVEYRGVEVGNVVKISLDPNHPEHVLVMTHVKPAIPLHVDTRAVIGNVGITGLAYIEVETEKNDSPALALVPGKDYYELQGAQSRFDQLLNEVPTLIEQYTHVADQLLILFDKDNLNNVALTLKNIENATQNLADHSKDIDLILANTRDTIHQFNESSTNSFSELNYFLRDSRSAAIEIKDLAKSLRENPSQIIYQPQYHGYQVEE